MKYKYILVACLSLIQVNCTYLDNVPEKDIETIESIFEQRGGAYNWFKTCYYLLQNIGSVSMYPAYTGADEFVASEFHRKEALSPGQPPGKFDGIFIGDGLQMSFEPYGDIWDNMTYYAGIRYCNTFIENIGRVYNMPEGEKNLWKAEIQALKAHFYYELMLHYGPIVLIPENVDLSDDASLMLKSRSNFDDCVEATVALLDEAMETLPPLSQKDFSRHTYHSLESAAALKAKVLLLAASPLFNGNPAYQGVTNKDGELLFSQSQDESKWKRAAEAADAAVEICESNGKKLISGSLKYNNPMRNIMEDIEKSVLAEGYENEEALYIVRKKDVYPNYTLPYILDNENEQHSLSDGTLCPSIKMVEMYYTKNGVPIDEDKTWDYTMRYKMGKEDSKNYETVVGLESENVNQVLNLHLRREPRFYAHIAADRCYWQRGQKVHDHNILVEPYRNEFLGTVSKRIDETIPQNLTGYWLKKGSYSEVVGKDYYNFSKRDEGTVIMRLPELYLIQAEAWNEYEGPSDKVYDALDKIRERADLPGVEEAWRTYSMYPEKITNKVGMREIIWNEWNIEFAFEGQRFWNLRRWMTAQNELNEAQYGWNIIGDDARTFYNNYEGPIVVWSKRKFLAPRDYLFPIKSEDILVSGNVQNPGW